jgi:hypothetical protein
MPSLKGRLFFFILYNIFNTLLSQKYVICIKTTTSPLSVFINKHIYLTNEEFNTPFDTHLTQSNPFVIK